MRPVVKPAVFATWGQLGLAAALCLVPWALVVLLILFLTRYGG